MKEYLQDIFYNVEALSQDERLELLKEAMFYSTEIRVDEIIGWQRQNVPDADPQEWLVNHLKPDSIWRFIHRRGYNETYYIQVVIREMECFLWVDLKEEHLDYFIKKYNLKRL